MPLAIRRCGMQQIDTVACITRVNAWRDHVPGVIEEADGDLALRPHAGRRYRCSIGFVVDGSWIGF